MQTALVMVIIWRPVENYTLFTMLGSLDTNGADHPVILELLINSLEIILAGALADKNTRC